MTDNEIIGALERVSSWECDTGKYEKVIADNVLDLINRQKKEIEELRKGFTADADYFASEYDKNIKAEAIKEFAERLKIKVEYGEFYDTTDDYIMTVEHIDDLVKQMTEVSE